MVFILKKKVSNMKFINRCSNYLKRVKKRWRRPRGIHNKLRKKEKSKGRIVTIGYRTEKSKRGLHPSGLEEVYVQNIKDLDKIDNKKQAARLASSIGKKKRQIILKRAEKLKIKVLNA